MEYEAGSVGCDRTPGPGRRPTPTSLGSGLLWLWFSLVALPPPGRLTSDPLAPALRSYYLIHALDQGCRLRTAPAPCREPRRVCRSLCFWCFQGVAGASCLFSAPDLKSAFSLGSFWWETIGGHSLSTWVLSAAGFVSVSRLFLWTELGIVFSDELLH